MYGSSSAYGGELRSGQHFHPATATHWHRRRRSDREDPVPRERELELLVARMESGIGAPPKARRLSSAQSRRPYGPGRGLPRYIPRRLVSVLRQWPASGTTESSRSRGPASVAGPRSHAATEL